MNARRTAVRLTFAGVDISTDINKHLLSLTYTDNEEDKTDDLQLSLDDREGVWLGNWLNTRRVKGRGNLRRHRSKELGIQRERPCA